MLNRLAFVVKRVLAKCGFNCFKAAEHRGDSRESFLIELYNAAPSLYIDTTKTQFISVLILSSILWSLDLFLVCRLFYFLLVR